MSRRGDGAPFVIVGVVVSDLFEKVLFTFEEDGPVFEEVFQASMQTARNSVSVSRSPSSRDIRGRRFNDVD